MIFLLLVVALISCTRAQSGVGVRQAVVTPPEVRTRLDNSANFTCGSDGGAPISVCLWQRRSDPAVFITFNPSNGKPGGQSPYVGYEYFGDGLESGSCGVLIKNVKDEDKAEWECTLIVNEGAPFVGKVDFIILKKPAKPQLADPNDGLTNLVDPEVSTHEQDIVITCFAEGGFPTPGFKWFVGDQEVKNEAPYLIQNYDGRNYTGQNLTGFKFTREHDGQFVKCVLVHETLEESEAGEFTVSRPISIQYPPRVVNAKSAVLVAGVGEPVTIAVNISANPQPEVKWFVGKDQPVKASETRPRYKAHSPIPILEHPGLHEYRLEIFKVEQKDLENVVKLEADNGLGPRIGGVEFKLTTSIQDAVGPDAFDKVFEKLAG